MFQVTVAKKDLETDSEIRFLQRARHPRLVMFLGCGRYMDEKKENIFLVLEFCDGGITALICMLRRKDLGPKGCCSFKM